MTTLKTANALSMQDTDRQIISNASDTQNDIQVKIS